MNIQLIKRKVLSPKHVSSDVSDELETIILNDSNLKTANSFAQYCFLPVFYAEKVFRRLSFSVISVLCKLFVKESASNEDAYFAILMGRDFSKYHPYAFFSRKKRFIYLFDAWPIDQDDIVDFINQFKIDKAFVSASQAASMLNQKLGKDIVYWIPEGINPTMYKYVGYDKKDIDVVNIGRKYDLYHERICSFLHDSNKIYLYEKEKGKLVFPTRESFIDGLSRSKISICVPSNITHPDRSGDIETMTNRYLQSMASKCLVLGYAPKEMIELFGYNPVIEIDMDNPTQQIENILNSYADYIPLIEKNYENVLNLHSWQNRWNQIKQIIE